MVIRRPRWHEHPHVPTGGQLTVGERAADWLKHWFGTWTALGLVGVVIAAWMGVQGLGGPKWDPYPYILLNLCLSCLAAVQGIILQISANRGDRISSDLAMHTFRNGEKLLEINQAQTALLKEVHSMQQAISALRGSQR